MCLNEIRGKTFKIFDIYKKGKCKMGKEAYRKFLKNTRNTITEDNTNVIEIEKVNLEFCGKTRLKANMLGQEPSGLKRERDQLFVFVIYKPKLL